MSNPEWHRRGSRSSGRCRDAFEQVEPSARLRVPRAVAVGGRGCVCQYEAVARSIHHDVEDAKFLHECFGFLGAKVWYLAVFQTEHDYPVELLALPYVTSQEMQTWRNWLVGRGSGSAGCDRGFKREAVIDQRLKGVAGGVDLVEACRIRLLDPRVSRPPAASADRAVPGRIKQADDPRHRAWDPDTQGLLWLGWSGLSPQGGRSGERSEIVCPSC